MVKSKKLLLIAGAVWLAAGVNILRIGILAYLPYLSMLNLGISLAVFTVFWFKIFRNLLVKHSRRIKQSTEEKQYFWKFFDRKSFLIMLLMMTFGMLIRTFSWMPENCIGIFYTGLGAALAFAGIQFAREYLKKQ
ncbi:MAG: hypothetical protein LKJ03_09230 [Enterococcaceae bacterium]|nr:hypothetical protein [Enterococcaceae bacterium]